MSYSKGILKTIFPDGFFRFLPKKTARRGVALIHRLGGVFARTCRQPLFVLGNQKSGTSAIARMLGERGGMSVTIDLYCDVLYPEHPQVINGEMSIEVFIRKNALDFSRNVIKDSNLTLLFPQLRKHFPYARFLFVVRDPRDNIRSILNRLRLSGTDASEEVRARHRLPRAWKPVLDMSWYGIEGNVIETLAYRWCTMMDIYFRDREQFVLCRYEDFCKNKSAEIDRLCDEMGIARRASIEHLLNRQFQHKGDARVTWRDFFGDDNLATIERICGEHMNTLGYESHNL